MKIKQNIRLRRFNANAGASRATRASYEIRMHSTTRLTRRRSPWVKAVRLNPRLAQTTAMPKVAFGEEADHGYSIALHRVISMESLAIDWLDEDRRNNSRLHA